MKNDVACRQSNRKSGGVSMVMVLRITAMVLIVLNVGFALAAQNWTAALGWFCAAIYLVGLICSEVSNTED